MSLTRLRLPGGLVNDSNQNLLGAGELFTTGKVWYVDSVTGSDGNTGDDPVSPLATIDQAVTNARANKGDIIVLMPLHAQNIANATTFQLDKAGLKVVGLGSGRTRPVFTFTATAGSVELDSANCEIENIVFVAGISAVVVGVNVDANDITIKNCEFNFSAGTFDFVRHIDIDTVVRTNVIGCKFVTEDLQGSECAIRLDSAAAVVIESNEFYGDWNSACVYGDGEAGAGIQILRNDLYNSDTTAGNVIDLNVAFRGLLAENNCGSLYATSANATIDTGSLLSLQNFVCNAIDESGRIVPSLLSGLGET